MANDSYEPWGKVLSVSEGTAVAGQPIGYAGYYYDKETKLYYLQARYYDPETARFVSRDPYPGDEDDPVSQNGYVYAGSNPVNYIDPNGWKHVQPPLGGGAITPPRPPVPSTPRGTGKFKIVNGFEAKVHPGKQGKHIPGHPNYQKGKSIFTGDAQKLLNKYAGTGQWIGSHKERVNFRQVIGKWVDPNTGKAY